ncbi:MAG: 1,6-anhydro-N-acetylmuramyl-L-alanine amidase AmpD [Motiliproteus sp.]
MTRNTQFRVIDGWLQQAEKCISPNKNERPEGEVSLLVIHNISLPPGRFGTPYVEQFFQNRLDSDADPYFKEICALEVSAHLLIKRSGQVSQFVSFDDRAWHAGLSCFQGRDQCNDFSIGIELEGTDETPYTDHQYEALSLICRSLFGLYPGLSVDRIVGHCDISPGRKTDPGPCFDWDRLKDSLSDVGGSHI